jgi:threonine synthase
MVGNGTASDRPPFDVLKARIGATPIRPAEALGRQLKIPNLFLKDETTNPSGTMFDRLSLVQVEAAIKGGHKTISVAAQDPRGVSLAILARSAGLECVVHVPEQASERWAVEARAANATVVRTRGFFFDAVERSAAESAEHDWYNASPAAGSEKQRVDAYAPMSKEILDGLKASPGVVAIPTRDGTAVAGLWAGFDRLKRRPKVLAATSKMGNPIVWSLAQGINECIDLDPKDVFPSATSEPLATHKAADGDAAVKAVRASGGWGYAASDEELENLARQLERTENVRVLPAAAAGIAALHFAARFARLDATAPCVAILTSRV